MVVIMTDLSSDSEVFVEAWDGKDVDWNRAFGKFNAAVDWPAAAFYKQLMEVYPDAKVIHTTRDPEKWYTSAMNTIMAINSVEGQPDLPPQMLQRQKMVKHIIFDGELKGSRDKEACVQMFKDHDEEVKRHVPADRLLWFETGVDGWDKLCAFLGKEVPNTPWPHVNKSEEFQSRIQKLSQGAPMDDLSPVKQD
jgi:hypothetical protein